MIMLEELLGIFTAIIHGYQSMIVEDPILFAKKTMLGEIL